MRGIIRLTMPLLPGAKLDGYEVLGLLGSGGMGEVYCARDPVLKREVAIKILPALVSQDPDRLRRFEQEAQAAAALNHPNILAIHRFGVFEGVPYLVSELLVGDTLRQQLERGPLPLRRAIDYGVQIAHGLAAAHTKGIVHRDLKPENLFVCKDGRLKILDFGLAKLLQPKPDPDGNALTQAHGTHPGMIMGTVGYMSPEQVRGTTVDHRADIFAFGAILYELTVGKRAFQRPTSAETMTAILNEDPPPISQIVQSIPPGLQRVVHRCLEKNPEERFQSASDLGFALEALSGISLGVDVPAPDRQWLRRAQALSIGLIVIVALAAVFYSYRASHAGHPESRLAHRQITFVGNAYMPAISPDGKSVAYVTHSGTEQKLMLQDLSGGPSLELLHGQTLDDPTWSSDGSRLMLAVGNQGKEEIFVISRLGGTPRLIGDGVYSCWLPSGTEIVTSWQNPGAGIRLVSLLNGEKKQIPAPEYQWLFGITCSTKTATLLLLTATADRYQIWSMKLDGTERRKLIEGESGITIRSAVWSPRGDAVYYLRSEGGVTALMRLPVSGQLGKPTALVSGLETGGYLTLSTDGSQLAYTRSQSYSNLWSVELPASGSTAEAREKPLTSGTLSYNEPVISPDGRSVAFTIGSDIKANIYKMAVGGGEPVQLTSFEAAGTWSPGWSPDGNEIAFISNQGGTPKVWIVNAEGGTARRLDATDDTYSNHFLAWSPSHDIVYAKKDMRNLRRVNVQTQEERLLLPVDSGGWLTAKPIVSPDGKKIATYWNRSPAAGTWLITLENFSTSLLYPDVVPFGWSSDGDFIYAFADPGGRVISEIKLGDSKKLRSVIAMPGDLTAGTVSPDGRKIIVSVGEEKSDVWLLKDFDPQTQAQ
ncbi:LpqB family beta-propeller domain-containing protein [Tunturiibacter lichenicola]|uniref:LpqB family beta-propeller domain-containing protein n=1 Tax=Tunturiibacter lichenicola TaxID=2051959 RepID=UPI003D9B0E47